MNTKSLIAIVLLFCLFLSPLLYAETYEEMYKRIFGRQVEDKIENIDVSLIIDKKPQGSISASVSAMGKQLRIEGLPLIDRLRANLLPDYLALIEQKIDDDGLISRESLDELGIQAGFSRRLLTIQITTPPLKRREINIYITGNGPAYFDLRPNIIRPSPFSGYCNFRTYKDLMPSSAFPESTGTIMQLDGAVSLHDWALKSRGTYYASDDSYFSLQQAYAENNDLKSLITTRIGAISYPLTGYQVNREVLGAGISSGTIKYWSGREKQYSQELKLTEPAAVGVFINGVTANTYLLDPGHYYFRNFPLVYGYNDIEIVVDTRSANGQGEVRKTFLSLFHDNRLNTISGEEYSIALGLPVIKSVRRWEFDNERPFLSAFHRKNVLNNLMIGTFCQGDPAHSILGIEAGYGVSYGLWQLNYGISFTPLSKTGQAVSIEFDNYIKPEFFRRMMVLKNWELSMTYKDKYFMMLDQESPNLYSALELAANLGFSATQWAGLNLNGYYTFNESYYNEYGFGISVSNRYILNSQLSYNWSGSASGESDYTIMFYGQAGLPFFEKEVKYSRNLVTQQDTVDIDHRLNVFKDDKLGTSVDVDQNGDYVASLGYTLGKSRTEFGISRTYLKNTTGIGSTRGNVTTQYAEYDRGRPSSRQQMSIQLDTAIAYADGHFAFSSPIRNGFVLFYPHPELEGIEIGFNRSDAKIDGFGAAVIPDLDPYRENSIMVKADNIPLGVDIGQQLYRLFPGQNSGFAIQVGAPGKVIVTGQMLDKNGNPMKLKSCRIFSPDNKDIQAATFFTNRKGKYQIIGLQPGNYRIQVFGLDAEDIIFNIPAGTKGLYKASDLIVHYKQPKSEVYAVSETVLVEYRKPDAGLAVTPQPSAAMPALPVLMPEEIVTEYKKVPVSELARILYRQDPSAIYRVVIASAYDEASLEPMIIKAKTAGIVTYIWQYRDNNGNVYYRLQAGSLMNRIFAEIFQKEARKRGFIGVIVKAE
ncbi:MAG: fimbria/pilus outer membrane usher protein [Candidatus Margulisiibacteriota bacterium]